MGMFDKPSYLTGNDGYAKPGDTFWLHNARVEGNATVGGESRPQAKLLVSRERDGEKTVVFTSGVGIVGQVRRMDAGDLAAMPVEVRLDAIPPQRQGNNPTNVLTPANLPAPTGGDGFSASGAVADF